MNVEELCVCYSRRQFYFHNLLHFFICQMKRKKKFKKINRLLVHTILFHKLHFSPDTILKSLSGFLSHLQVCCKSATN